MRKSGLVFAGLVAAGLICSGPASLGGSAAAAEADPAKVSTVAGDFAGVAESCGLETQAYAARVEELLKHLAGSSEESEQLIANFETHRKETAAKEESERSIDCMDAKRRFEELPINQPSWTVETGWASEML